MDAEAVTGDEDSVMIGPQAADPIRESESDAVISQLSLIDQQPLESRAAAFGLVYDRLQRRLEGGDS